jgi:hypothetical protein
MRGGLAMKIPHAITIAVILLLTVGLWVTACHEPRQAVTADEEQPGEVRPRSRARRMNRWRTVASC